MDAPNPGATGLGADSEGPIMNRGSGIPAFSADMVVGLTIFGCSLGAVAGLDGWSIAQAAAADPPGSNVAWAPLVLAHDADGAGLAALLQLRDAAGMAARMAVFGLTFATMFAFNMAFVRHLRRVYASPRRNGWRRGRRPVSTGS